MENMKVVATKHTVTINRVGMVLWGWRPCGVRAAIPEFNTCIQVEVVVTWKHMVGMVGTCRQMAEMTLRYEI